MKTDLRIVNRLFWHNLIENAWKKRSIIWLKGVRRSGKTSLCKSLPSISYYDCELPRVRRLLSDPEEFLKKHLGQRIVLDEIHRLDNPSELLKIAADHFPACKVIATGSSSLGASRKFSDTLTGRKTELMLTPLISDDLDVFPHKSVEHRFLNGGLPPFFLSSEGIERDAGEWMESFWAKDIQEDFRLERRSSFLKFCELILAKSGGIFEATSYATPCEVSRVTVSNYLNVLEETMVVHVIRPYSSRRSNEIISAPKIYSFDTGMFCVFKGWESLRHDDFGILWEQLVLNEIMAKRQSRKINYWRDKQGHEVDFVLVKSRDRVVAIECKWSANSAALNNFQIFRQSYPRGENIVVAHDVDEAYVEKKNNLAIHFVGLKELMALLG